MPAVARPRRFGVQTLDPSSPRTQFVQVPKRMAQALRSEVARGEIPTHATMDPSTVPYAGELTEQMHSLAKVPIQPSERRVLATLRRPWNIIGFSVDPGGASNNITAALMVWVRGMSAIVPATVLVVSPGFPVASVGFFMGCRCQLVVIGQTGEGASPSAGVRGTIWGMSEQ